MAQRYLSAARAADELGTTYETVIARLHDGRVPAVRSQFDGKLYVRERDLPLLASTLRRADWRRANGRRYRRGGAAR